MFEDLARKVMTRSDLIKRWECAIYNAAFQKGYEYRQKVEQAEKMKDELACDWARMSEIFRQSPVERQVLMLRSLDRNMRTWE